MPTGGGPWHASCFDDPAMYDLPKSDAAASPALAPEAEERPGVAVEPSRVLAALRDARRPALAAALVGGAMGFVVGKTILAQQWASEATLLVAAPSAGPGESGASGGDAARHVRTVAETVKIEPLLGRVRSELGLSEPIEKLGKSIEVEASPDTNLVTVRTKRESARLATDLADAVTRAHVAARLASEKARLDDEVRHLDDEVARARRELDAARVEHEAFRRDNHLSDLAAELRVTLELATHHASDAESAGAVAEAERERARVLRDVAASEPALTIIAEQQVTPEASKLAEIRAQIAAERGRLDDAHPRLASLLAQASALETQLATRTPGLVTSQTLARNPRLEQIQQHLSNATSEQVAAQRKRESLTGAAASARTRIAELSALAGPLTALESEVKHREEHLRHVENRRAGVIEAARAPRADVSILSAATVPRHPLKPTARIAAVAFAAALALGATILTLARAFRGLRVTTTREAAFWSRVPTVAAVRGASAEALAGLCEDLVPERGALVGHTLLVHLVPGDLSLALGVARFLGDASVASLRDGDPVDDCRRKARSAERVLVLVRAGRHGARELAGLRQRLATPRPVGLALYGLGERELALPDRVGDARAFLGAPVAIAST